MTKQFYGARDIMDLLGVSREQELSADPKMNYEYPKGFS